MAAFVREIRPVWLNVPATMLDGETGPYSIYFSKIGKFDYAGGYPHWVFWNGFPLHCDPIEGYNKIWSFIQEFETSLGLA